MWTCNLIIILQFFYILNASTQLPYHSQIKNPNVFRWAKIPCNLKNNLMYYFLIVKIVFQRRIKLSSNYVIAYIYKNKIIVVIHAQEPSPLSSWKAEHFLHRSCIGSGINEEFFRISIIYMCQRHANFN